MHWSSISIQVPLVCRQRQSLTVAKATLMEIHLKLWEIITSSGANFMVNHSYSSLCLTSLAKGSASHSYSRHRQRTQNLAQTASCLQSRTCKVWCRDGNENLIRARHEKTDPKVFVVVILKEGWARMAAPILLLVRHRLFRIWVFLA